MVWRGKPGEPLVDSRYYQRLTPLREALERRGLLVEVLLYGEDRERTLEARLTACDAILVWVDPVTAGRGRTSLDQLLSSLASPGRWVSAHPETIAAIGTKRVLYDCQDMSWGVPCALYRSPAELHDGLAERCRSGVTTVLKPLRGNGGLGVWKVAPGHPINPGSPDVLVYAQDAGRRDDVIEQLPLVEMVARLRPALADGGALVGQRYVDGLRLGMVRAYLSAETVIGFSTQLPAVAADHARGPHVDPVFAMAAAKTMFPPDEARFASLRADLERAWIPELRRRFRLPTSRLPAIWDLDFLQAPRPGGARFVLCEINVSCVSPFPDLAVDAIADTVVERVGDGAV
jgi:hypothetical protein